jgi:hypothetical protein
MTAPAQAPAPIAFEKKTVAAMVDIYCGDQHGHRHELCDECQTLLRYSHGRLDKCPYGAEKPVCRECPIHCYRPAERAAMRDVMRYSGPKMLLRHPWLALVHLWKEHLRKRRAVEGALRDKAPAAPERGSGA